MKLNLSNPRLQATIGNWPLGGNKRGNCNFVVETGKKGQRISRQTTGKPKFSTYADKACIVDGDNGKTYLLFLTLMHGNAVSISSGDFMDARPEETGLQNTAAVFADSNPELFAKLKKLIDEAV